MIKEELYLGEYDSVEALEAGMEMYWSGSRFDKYGGCWRRGAHTYDDGLQIVGSVKHPMVAGSALHGALAYLYAMGGPQGIGASGLSGAVEQSLEILRTTVDQRGGLPPLPADHKYHHLTTGHCEIILKNYVSWAKLHDSFKPIILPYEELCMEDVAGARLRLTDDGRVILGESALIMRMSVDVPWSDEPVQYNYAGVPDLPVAMGGFDYVMDHKTTGSNLGSWWAAKYRVDNTLRVYCVMLQKLMKNRKKPLRGLLINGITTQKNAVNPKSKCTRFGRFGPWDYDVGALYEALLNHAAILKMREFMSENLGGYSPQIPGMSCANCDMLRLCVQDPAIRAATAFTEYERRPDYSLLRLADSGE